MDGISAVNMSLEQIASNYSTLLMKKSMDTAATQAAALINDMLAATPAPSEYNFDVYG